MIPVKKVRMRSAKYDVCLRESSLRAVQAMHTILTRMVMFSCNWCRERFPTFHPAFAPPPWLEKKMEILKKGRDGVAACNVEVASWDDVPAFPGEEDGDGLIASQHRGVCLRCQKDIDRQMAHAGADATVADVVPKWSFLNVMDPLYKFPFEMQQLFDMATPTEAMLVALEHMQVSYTTVSWTGLSKFRRNVISFQRTSRVCSAMK